MALLISSYWLGLFIICNIKICNGGEDCKFIHS